MATKCTWLFQLQTAFSSGTPARLGGWSESWYSASDFGDTLVANFRALGQRRANLLPSSAVIVGMRFQATDGFTSGSSESVAAILPGTSGIDNDAPQVALKVQLNGEGNANKKILILRGIPDDIVKRGEYVPTSGFRTNFNGFLAELTRGWAWRGQVLNATSSALLTIAADGTFVCEDVTAIASNQMVKVLRARNSGGRQKGGIYKTQNVVGAGGTLLNWNHGACTGGRMRRNLIFFPTVPSTFGSPPTPEVIVKKVGRPFNQYRGRKPVRSPG